MTRKKGFINIAVLIAVIALAVAGSYIALNRRALLPSPTVSIPNPLPAPQACSQEAKQCPGGSYVGRTGQNCEFAACPGASGKILPPGPTPTPIPAERVETITKKAGEQEGAFLIQRINADSVDGRWFAPSPVVRSDDPGAPRTLRIGDDIGYACAGISERIIAVDASGQTVTFTKTTGRSPLGGCPICLSGGTFIDTSAGLVRVENMRVGMRIWTVDSAGRRVQGIVLKTSQVPVSPTHQMAHLILDDGREIFASPGHPTIDGRTVGDFAAGDQYDGALVKTAARVPYDHDFTYDVLPSGPTGFYWANGILLGSTLR